MLSKNERNRIAAGRCRCGAELDGLYRNCADCRKKRACRRAKHHEKYLADQRTYKQQLRLDALHAYGGEHPVCACPGCVEDRVPFLCIDHTDGNGAKHRVETWNRANPGGGAVCRWLKKNGYPPGFRVLCYNCNTARSRGPCPVHEV